MRKVLMTLGFLATGMTIGWTVDVKAEMILCNQFEQPIYIAFSQQKADRPQAGAIVKGWWYTKPGQCQTVYPNSLSNGEKYGYYAISADGKRNWSGDNNSGEICISDRGFDLTTTTKSQCNAPSYPVKFQSIDAKNRTNVSFDIKN
jgi:uncharacterized membrane protein